MLESVVFPVIVGFIWGLAVNLFNNFLTWRTLAKPGSILCTLVFVLRQVLNILAMFLVYKNVAMLIGTAMGLLAVKNYIFLKNLNTLFRERKG